MSERLLGDLADLTVGHVGPMASEYVGYGIPFLRSLNVQPFRLDLAGVKFITPEFHAKLQKSALGPGDVVVVRTGVPGTAAVIPESLPVANCSDVVIVRPGPELDSRYLCYLINSIARGYINSRVVGAVQQHFNVGAARGIPIPATSPDEQRRIAGVLGALDDLIETNRATAAQLVELVDAEFERRFGDRELGVAVGELAEVIDCLHSKKPERVAGGRILMQLNNIRDDGMVERGYSYGVSEQDYTNWSRKFQTRAWDLVITNVGRIGAVARIPARYTVALGRNMTGIRPCDPGESGAFLAAALLSPAVREEIEARTDSGTVMNALNVRSIPLLGLQYTTSGSAVRFSDGLLRCTCKLMPPWRRSSISLVLVTQSFRY